MPCSEVLSNQLLEIYVAFVSLFFKWWKKHHHIPVSNKVSSEAVTQHESLWYVANILFGRIIHVQSCYARAWLFDGFTRITHKQVCYEACGSCSGKFWWYNHLSKSMPLWTTQTENKRRAKIGLVGLDSEVSASEFEAHQRRALRKVDDFETALASFGDRKESDVRRKGAAI